MSILEINLGMNPLDTVPTTIHGITNEEWFRACNIPPSMMSTTGWQNEGNNSSGFNLIGPDYTTLWTSSLENGSYNYDDPHDVFYWGRDFHFEVDYIRRYPRNIRNWHSCRCLQD